jgi:transcriptional regulator with XRE-family HTH domain
MQLTLKAARIKKGWSLDRLADASGINKSTISRLERGETQPLHDTVQQLERALGLKAGELKFDAVEARA